MFVEISIKSGSGLGAPLLLFLGFLQQKPTGSERV